MENGNCSKHSIFLHVQNLSTKYNQNLKQLFKQPFNIFTNMSTTFDNNQLTFFAMQQPTTVANHTTTPSSTPPPAAVTPNRGIQKKKTQVKGKHSRETTIVYLSPRKEGQNLRHKYCKGVLTDRESRKYLRSLEVRVQQQQQLPSSTPTMQEEGSPSMCDDDTTTYDSFDSSCWDSHSTSSSTFSSGEVKPMVVSSLSMRKEGRNMRHQYIKGVLSKRETRKYMKCLD